MNTADVKSTGMPVADPAPARRSLRRFLPVAVLLSGLAGFFLLGLGEYLSLSMMTEHILELDRLVAENFWLSATVFTSVYALLTAFSVPGGLVLTLLGGCVFGTWLGTALVVTGATVGACGVFLAARTAFEETLRRRARGWLGRFEHGFRRNALSYLLVLRLVPLFPFWLVNIVPAFLGVPLRTYVIGTLIGIIPGSFVYASVGNGLSALVAVGEEPDLGAIFAPEILLPILGLAMLALVPVFYRRFSTDHGEERP